MWMYSELTRFFPLELLCIFYGLEDLEEQIILEVERTSNTDDRTIIEFIWIIFYIMLIRKMYNTQMLNQLVLLVPYCLWLLVHEMTSQTSKPPCFWKWIFYQSTFHNVSILLKGIHQSPRVSILDSIPKNRNALFMNSCCDSLKLDVYLKGSIEIGGGR